MKRKKKIEKEMKRKTREEKERKRRKIEEGKEDRGDMYEKDGYNKRKKVKGKKRERL